MILFWFHGFWISLLSENWDLLAEAGKRVKSNIQSELDYHNFFLQFWWINWCFIYFGHGKRPETARRAQAEAPAAPMILLLSAANQNPVRKQSINSTYIKYSWYVINSPGQNGPNSKQAENGDSYKLKKKSFVTIFFLPFSLLKELILILILLLLINTTVETSS